MEIYEEIKNLFDGFLFVIWDFFVEGNWDKVDIYKGLVIVLVNEFIYFGVLIFVFVIKKFYVGKVFGEIGCLIVYFGNYMLFILFNF